MVSSGQSDFSGMSLRLCMFTMGQPHRYAIARYASGVILAETSAGYRAGHGGRLGDGENGRRRILFLVHEFSR